MAAVDVQVLDISVLLLSAGIYQIIRNWLSTIWTGYSKKEPEFGDIGLHVSADSQYCFGLIPLATETP